MMRAGDRCVDEMKMILNGCLVGLGVNQRNVTEASRRRKSQPTEPIPSLLPVLSLASQLFFTHRQKKGLNFYFLRAPSPIALIPFIALLTIPKGR
jgi:hypothetical protein